MKLQRDTLVFFLSAILLLLCSCNKDIRSNKTASEYFPNTVGNYWEYDVYDSSDIRDHPNVPRGYTVKVAITGTKTLANNITATIWQYDLPWGIEEKFVTVTMDTVKVYDSTRAVGTTYLLYPDELFITPFVDGQSWKSLLLWTDSFFVRKEYFTGYQETVKIQRKYTGQQSYYSNEYWFSEKVGFVKIAKDERNQGIRTKEIWTLKYFNLK